MSTAIERAEAASCCDDPEDRSWGRLPGAGPPLRWWLPLAVFLTAAITLTLLIVFVVRTPGPLDDPDPANQRDGLLLDGPRLPSELGNVSFGDRPVVLLFERTAPTGPGFATWRDAISDDGVALGVVLAGSPEAAELAAAVNIPTPVDGGSPIGYAVIDSARVVRYSTLDPMYELNAFEVDVITGAIG